MNQPVYSVPARHSFDINENQQSLAVSNPIEQQSKLQFDAFHDANSFYTPVSLFSYGDKVKISFSLKASYIKYFALIKGLLEFNRSRSYHINYDRSENLFDVSADASQLESVQTFLKKITVWLDREIKFKQTLKTIIQFEADYRKRTAEVYQQQHKQLF